MLGAEVTRAVFADPATAPISDQLKAALGLVRKLTLSPEEVGADDIRATLAVGVSEDGVIDVLYVCFAFNLIDRVADALGFDLMDEEGYRQAAQALLRFGYKPGAPPTAGTKPNLVRPWTPNPNEPPGSGSSIQRYAQAPGAATEISALLNRSASWRALVTA